MAVSSIDFNKVITYSLSHCFQKSKSKCAEYVKRAFEVGGCKYIGGNGWSNQRWCKENGFQLIGDFVPEDYQPRAHNGKPIQFPAGYKQQAGDVCLIDHGVYGHICYAMSDDIDSWVSDYFQKYPGQQTGTGPYCYGEGNVRRVQFWRHSSVLNGAPVINVPTTPNTYPINDYAKSRNSGYSGSSSTESLTVNELSSMNDDERTNRGITLGYNMRQR